MYLLQFVSDENNPSKWVTKADSITKDHLRTFVSSYITRFYDATKAIEKCESCKVENHELDENVAGIAFEREFLLRLLGIDNDPNPGSGIDGLIALFGVHEYADDKNSTTVVLIPAKKTSNGWKHQPIDVDRDPSTIRIGYERWPNLQSANIQFVRNNFTTFLDTILEIQDL